MSMSLGTSLDLIQHITCYFTPIADYSAADRHSLGVYTARAGEQLLHYVGVLIEAFGHILAYLYEENSN